MFGLSATMYKYLPLLATFSANAGVYIDIGLGVPLTPDSGYMPDMYGIAAIGYVHQFDNIVSLDLGLVHRSLTGTDPCHDNNCYGDNAIETKIRLEW